jgi:quercetin dioxygenase-like cupin family protein
MAVRHVRDVPEEPVPAGEGASRFMLIGPGEGPNFAMRKFVIRAGGRMPLHTNTVEHEQYVLAGSADVRIGDDVHRLEPGSVVLIPAGVPHDYRVVGHEDFEFLCMVPNAEDRMELLE